MLTGTTEGDTMDGNDGLPALGQYEQVQLLPTAPLMQDLDGMVRDLTRVVDPGGYALLCPITGCRWELQVPAAQLVQDLDAAAGRYVIRAHGYGREQLERAVGAHMDWHAVLTETAAGEPCAGCTPDELVDDCPVHDPQDPEAAAGVDPRSGTPLEQSGVNVRLAP